MYFFELNLDCMVKCTGTNRVQPARSSITSGTDEIAASKFSVAGCVIEASWAATAPSIDSPNEMIFLPVCRSVAKLYAVKASA